MTTPTPKDVAGRSPASSGSAEQKVRYDAVALALSYELSVDDVLAIATYIETGEELDEESA